MIIKQCVNGWLVLDADGRYVYESVLGLIQHVAETYSDPTTKYSERRVIIAELPGSDWSGELDDAYRKSIEGLRDRCNDALETPWPRYADSEADALLSTK